MKARAESRAPVIAKALGFSLVYAAAIVLFDSLYLTRRISSREISAALAIALVQCVAIVTLLGFSFCAKLWRELLDSRDARVRPHVRELLGAHAAGIDRRAEIRRIAEKYPREVEACVVEFLGMLRGGGRETVSRLASELGLIRRWKTQYRSRHVLRRRQAIARLALVDQSLAQETLRTAMADPDESVRLHTGRALLLNCQPGQAADVFRLAVTGSLITRAILTEDLRPHAMELADVILRTLCSGNEDRVVAVLEMVHSWNTFLPLPYIYGLLRHQNARVRTAALRVLPEVPRLHQLESEILYALGAAEQEVRAAAAMTAGRMAVAGVLTALARLVHEDCSDAAAAAAWALAQFGTAGRQVLEQETFTGPPLAASVALEALEQAQVSGNELAVPV